jgi:MFS transporter, PAT family, beta-lactamase induction signal transducer AmpG
MKKNNPWSFIPTQYFAEGLPYVIVNTMSVAMFKSLGASNEFIGLTSFLYIPWAIKFLWGPFVDANSTKRKWLLWMQLILSICFVLMALSLHLTIFTLIALIIFSIISFISATHDIATDGFYLHALNKKDQAFFTGIRSTFYRISMIFGSGLLVWLAGYLGGNTGNIYHGWSVAFFITAGIFLLFFLYHSKILPYPHTDKPVREIVKESSKVPIAKVFREYFTQDKIGLILTFILTYRLGEGILVKMAQPFLLDELNKGGLHISLGNVGIMYGTFGIIALLIGGILGGWLVKNYSLKKLIFPLALAMNIPNILYAFLALYKPGIIVIQSCIIIEQFGYGLGFTAFMIYLLYISRGTFKTSHYAISTGIMAVGMMIPGFISGFLQQQLGYFWLFITSFIFTIPGMIIIFFLPYYENNTE